MELTHFSRETEATVVADHLRAWSYAIADDVADHATMEWFAAVAEPFVSRSDTGRDEYDGRDTRHTGALIARCPTSREPVMHPIVLGTVGAFLDHVTSFQLHLTQSTSIEPGEARPEAHTPPAGAASR